MSHKDAKRTSIGKSLSSQPSGRRLWERLIEDCNFSEKEFLEKNEDSNFTHKQLLEFYWTVHQIELPFDDKI